jgi:uncharacterized membrane protein
MQRILIWSLVLLALIGIADSSYLAHAALTNSPLNCGLFDGCNVVAQSPYSKVFGIPLALFGLVYYVIALVLSAILVSSAGARMRQAMFLWSGVGVLFSAYFMYIQYFLIEAICIYCVISAIVTGLLFILALLLLRKDSVE